MPSLSQPRLDLQWRGTLSDYVTAIVWSANGEQVAVCSAAGEIQCLNVITQHLVQVQRASGQSVDTLDFSHDSQFLAAGGQDGSLYIWQMTSATPQLLTRLPHSTWMEHLLWHPHRLELAFSLGRYAQIWDAQTQQVSTTLPFASSTVLDLAWHPQRDYLAVAGDQSVKIWNLEDKDADPDVRELPTASIRVAWSADGNYLASGNLDRSLVVWPWDLPFPWRMTGFPGKVRQLAWSTVPVGTAPLLAAASTTGILTWQKQEQGDQDWTAQVLDWHQQQVNAIAFQPGTALLASASADGYICLWQQGHKRVQSCKGSASGLSCLAWQPNGSTLAVGDQRGEWQLWSPSQRGQGFS